MVDEGVEAPEEGEPETVAERDECICEDYVRMASDGSIAPGRGLAGRITQALMEKYGLSEGSISQALRLLDKPRNLSLAIFERNESMFREYDGGNGKSIEELAAKHGLVPTTVRQLLGKMSRTARPDPTGKAKLEESVKQPRTRKVRPGKNAKVFRPKRERVEVIGRAKAESGWKAARDARIREDRDRMKEEGFQGSIIQALMEKHNLSRASIHEALRDPDQPRYMLPEVADRNERMRREHEAGKPVEDLAAENELSLLTVKGILRPKDGSRAAQPGARARSQHGPGRVLSLRINPFVETALVEEAEQRDGPRKLSPGQMAGEVLSEWAGQRANGASDGAADG